MSTQTYVHGCSQSFIHKSLQTETTQMSINWMDKGNVSLPLHNKRNYCTDPRNCMDKSQMGNVRERNQAQKKPDIKFWKQIHL